MSDRKSEEGGRTDFIAAIKAIGFELDDYDLMVDTVDPEKRNGATKEVCKTGYNIAGGVFEVRESEKTEAIKWAGGALTGMLVAAASRAVPNKNNRFRYELAHNEIVFNFKNTPENIPARELQIRLAAFAGAVSEVLGETRLIEPYIMLKNTVFFPENGDREPAFVVRCADRYNRSFLQIDDEHLARLTERNLKLLRKDRFGLHENFSSELVYCPKPSHIAFVDTEDRRNFVQMVEERRGKGWQLERE